MEPYPYLIPLISLSGSAFLSFGITVLVSTGKANPFDKRQVVDLYEDRVVINGTALPLDTVSSIEEYSYNIWTRHFIFEEQPYLLVVTNTGKFSIPKNLTNYSTLKNELIKRSKLTPVEFTPEKKSLLVFQAVLISGKWAKLNYQTNTPTSSRIFSDIPTHSKVRK